MDEIDNELDLRVETAKTAEQFINGFSITGNHDVLSQLKINALLLLISFNVIEYVAASGTPEKIAAMDVNDSSGRYFLIFGKREELQTIHLRIEAKIKRIRAGEKV